MRKRSVIAIGNFDGVHRGHRAIIAHAKDLANHHDAELHVLAFDPHPKTILKPEAAPLRLATREQKIQLLKQAGAQQVEILTPSTDLLNTSAETFVGQLAEKYHPVAIVEGANFRFGKGRAGDVDYLKQVGKGYGFDMVVAQSVEVVLEDLLVVAVSSSLIRWLIAVGRVADAARCLGRQYTLKATVVEGEKRGRTIGVPTANFDESQLLGRAVPANGVYAGIIELPDQTEYPAAISVGVKPTFGVHSLTIESHLLDFSGDLYNQEISVKFGRWLRDQQPFGGIEQLKAQLARDIATTRQWHAAGMLKNNDNRRPRTTAVADDRK